MSVIWGWKMIGAHLGRSGSWAKLHQGRLPVRKVGGGWCTTTEELDAFLGVPVSRVDSAELATAANPSRPRLALVPADGPTPVAREPHGDEEPVRRYDCQSYGACLSEAADAGWPSFVCGDCSRFEPLTPEERADDLPGLVALAHVATQELAARTVGLARWAQARRTKACSMTTRTTTETSQSSRTSSAG